MDEVAWSVLMLWRQKCTDDWERHWVDLLMHKESGQVDVQLEAQRRLLSMNARMRGGGQWSLVSIELVT